MNAITPIKPDVAKGITAQGRYVVTPDGVALGYNNNRDVERILTLMDSSLRKYNASPPTHVEVKPELLDEQTAIRPSSGTTLIRSFSRIRPVPVGSDIANANVARDHLWITPEESATMRASDLVPPTLITRMCRFHFIDNVRGEPDPWLTSEILKKEFKLKPLSTRAKQLTVSFKMEKPGSKLGVEGSALFKLEWNQRGELQFEGIVEATAWGAGQWTGTPPTGRFRLVQAYMTVDDAMAKVVPPQFIVFGNEYFAR
ncbi:MAG: hypothetical protein ABL949_13010 [Fimbriimonadaceae bacterium]